jgi:protein-S-isoprenylcysteine O-methyltransferase Ste14
MSLGAFLERRRVAISWVFAATYLVFAFPRPASLAAGFVVMCLGAAFRTWASGHIRKQEKLAVDGPYAHTRNPLYFGSFLIACGALVMGMNGWVAALFAAVAVPLYWTVMAREEEFLAGRFGSEFLRYRASVPRFLPRPVPYCRGGAAFSWALVRRHREWHVWAGIAGVTLLLVGKYYLL